MSGITYIVMVLGILLAKVLGFGRNVIFASAFGANEYTDIYFQVFGIASFLFTGVGTALGTLVIKNLNKAENSLTDARKRYVSRFICRISLIIIALTALMYLGTDIIVELLLPGLDEAFLPAARQMLRIMLPSGLFIIVAYIIAGILQNCKKFFITSIMSLPYNIIVIAVLLFRDVDIFAISAITTFGWFMHAVILLPSFYREGLRIFYRGDGVSPAISRERSLEVLYIFISSMMFHMCFVFDKAAVSHDVGAATTINYASSLFSTIASVFVVAMSNVSFPSISKNYEKGDKAAIQKTTVQLISLLFAIIVPFILVALIFGGDIIALLYERGEFTHELTQETAILFTIYTFGIFGYICQELFNKLLYLDSRYAAPVVGSITIILAKPLINLAATRYGVVAIAVSTTILFTVYAIVIASAIIKVTGNYVTAELGRNLLKILGAGICALAALWIFRAVGFDGIGGRLGFIIPLAACGIVYVAVIWLSGLVRVLLPRRQEA